MVSTRQMATSNNGGGASPSASSSSGGGNNSSANHHANAFESARLSVVTRQTSSNYVLVNCSTIPPPSPIPTQRSLAHAAIGVGPSTSASSARHNNSSTAVMHLTHRVKSQGGFKMLSADKDDDSITSSQLNIQDLPIELLSEILTYVGYKKIGQLRVVSHKFNDVCMMILNSNFSRLITQTYNRFHAIKANMPRRESARRNHPLACECDIIETCYMRLSLLQMTFGKHIERGYCCFFPGAILDEVHTILNYIKNTPRLERPYRVTDELFDLSTMAMEYFRDHIEPTLPDIACFNKDYFKLPTNTKRPALVITSDLSDSSSPLPSPPQSNMVLRKGIRKIKQGMKIYNNQLSVLRSELRTCKRKSSEQGKQIADQQKLLAEQQKQTLEYANRLDENDKKNEEMSRKFSTLLQELNKCKTELQYWRSKSPAIPTCTSCGQKVAPMLPPEDYQALINQGVKPEDIILNLSDDTDAESDASMSENNVFLRNEFVFPDEATTAKLLAVNTATKNLKRQHVASNCNNKATSNMNTSMGNSDSGSAAGTSEASSSNTIITGNICDDKNCNMSEQSMGKLEMSLMTSKLSEMTNCLDNTKRGNIIRTTVTNVSAAAVAAAVAGAAELQNQTESQRQKQNKVKDLNNIVVGDVVNNDNITTATSCSNDLANKSGTLGGDSGYSTKLFYGSNTHKGVIVSPPSILAKIQIPITAAGNAAATTALAENATDAAGSVAVGGASISAQHFQQQSAHAEDVVALQAITSHETKKARRVQKATRCLNGSGKRSK